MQQYADIYLLQSHSTCFGCHSTPSSVLKTVTAASDTGQNIGTATSLQRDLIRTVLCTNQSNTNEDNATKFKQKYVRCVRN